MRLALSWLLLASTVAAQEEEWIGKTFMPRINALPIAANGQVHGGRITMPLVVKAVDGELLDVGGLRYRKPDVVPLERAEEYYTSVLELNPRSDQCYNRRAIVRKYIGLHDQAIEDYSTAIRLNPTVAYYYANRGNLWHYSKRDNAAALKDYNEAIRLDATSAKVFYARGGIFRVKNELEAALADYNEAIRLDPNYVAAFNDRGLVWKGKGDLAAAIQDHEETIRLDGKYLLGYSNLAWILATANDPKFRDGQRAVAAATIACELTSWREVGPVRALAAACAENGDFGAAIQTQNKALQLISEKNQLAEQTRLKLYLAGKPYREKTAKSGK